MSRRFKIELIVNLVFLFIQRARAEAAAAEKARAASEERRRQEAEAQRKERDQAKAAAKREKKRLRNLCVDRYDHFIQAAVAADASRSSGEVKVQTLQDIDFVCQAMSTLE